MTTRSDARRVLALLDLTDLSDAATATATRSLAGKAVTSHGSVAALCVFPRFVREAKEALGAAPVMVATVANFPDGGEDTRAVEREAAQAIEDGADEVDLVMPWRAFLAGRAGFAESQIVRVRRLLPEGRILKVILETGALHTPEAIGEASRLAIGAGAHMIKTSTGKAAVNATPEAATIMLTAIRDSGANVGFKAAGGIRTAAAAIEYLAIADRIMGEGWARPSTFRLGASSLLDDLLGILDD